MMRDRWKITPTIGVFKGYRPDRRPHGLSWFGFRLWLILFRNIWLLERGRDAFAVLDLLTAELGDLCQVRTTDARVDDEAAA